MVKFDAKVNPRIKEMEQMLTLQQRDVAEMLKKTDRRFTGNMRRLFATQGASGGESWRPLSARYKRWKDRHYPGRKIMARTGKLRRSLGSKSDSRHFARAFLQPRATLKMGTTVRYAAYHVDDRDPLAHTARQMLEYTNDVQLVLRAKLRRVRREMAAASRVT